MGSPLHIWSIEYPVFLLNQQNYLINFYAEVSEKYKGKQFSKNIRNYSYIVMNI